MKLIPILASFMMAGMTISVQAETEPRQLQLTDIMKFESLVKPQLAANGQVMAVEVRPDRGDSHVLVKRTDNSKSYQMANAAKPIISQDGRFVAAELPITLLDKASKDKKALKKLKAGMQLLDTHTGEIQTFERVESFAFNQQGTALVIWFEPPEKDKKADKDNNQDDDASDAVTPDKSDVGRPMTVMLLKSQQALAFEAVNRYALAKASSQLLLSVVTDEGDLLLLIDAASGKQTPVHQSDDQVIGALALSGDGQQQAFIVGDRTTHIDERVYQLRLVQAGNVSKVADNRHWPLNRYSQLRFDEQGRQLFFGRVPEVSRVLALEKITTTEDLYDIDKISAQRNLNLWHGDDARIKPNEIKQYEAKVKQTYWAALDTKHGRIQQLADPDVMDVHWPVAGDQVLMSTDKPYLKMITWAGFYRDYYVYDLKRGERRLVLTQQASSQRPSMSANGRYMVYFQQGQVKLYEVAADRHVSLTAELGVPFANEDHDYPSSAPGYGFGPWLADDSGVLVYDKYDIWQLSTQGKAPIKLTSGRESAQQFRLTGLIDTKDKISTIEANQALLVTAYSERTKADSLHRVNVGQSGTQLLMNDAAKVSVVARAELDDTLLLTKERYDLFPDLYAAKLFAPADARQLTDLDKQRQPFKWSQAELVQWTGGDGRQLDGVLIKPTNYQAGKPVPVLVYFYRFMSDRLHAFPQMKVNHRPNFAWYSDNGYAVFLPDIRFEVGYPGPSSVQALTSGVQKLIDMGIADANAVGIQGHSWGGYQTAFVVTQTPIFKAAVSGAPVSNMTSAYSGIRHGTGLARQFQYETGQSRIGESLFDAQQKYIENSPVFYADRIKTPMMIMFGDKDDAVPWEQGIEMYLAMRRAGKDVVLLQYEDEPHHLKKYPNKLDYSVRMMQYFDHYLKGAKAPMWLEQGEAYLERPDAD
ncbi:prolyl oligopeptidase family serine peptidase [Shewanella sp. NIFS-20-20]|uniref:S9 family peptidase n=1 Tax=Shewanella sp. NIFS-20-20 TaxID=2853806 RepID=UPI001C4602C2|nr:prolyl oligopeptidase family serine peptidase [Shewanella sp. NIFS-20-20]MBV7315353.1 prolyl oligopeptidase family serine peptidase [Shewanella sp. NIFS-20-20]